MANDPNRQPPENAAVGQTHETTVEFFASLAELFVIILFIMTFVFQNFEIPSSSMEDGLLIGDHVLVNREQFAPKTDWVGPLLPYREIRRGDVVVFLSPETPGMFIVKRIIGVPGDRIHLRDGNVYRNGERLQEPYTEHKLGNYEPYRDNFPAYPPAEVYGVTSDDWRHSMASYIQGEDIVVPPSSYFGMGDNRDVSKDSRYWGFIPRENIIGRPLLIYWSFITPPNQYLERGLTDRAAFLAKVILHFFDQTRWSRTLRIVR
jgi:signal peptidase I